MAQKALQILIIIALFAMILINPAGAKERPILKDQWNNQTVIWMARAWIAESGWPKTEIRKQEQHAIGHALITNWKQITIRWPNMKLVTVIRNYCSGLGYMNEIKPTKRQLWVRNLFDETEPEGWPRSYASWEKHLPFWKDTLKRVEKFSHGKISNPCPGASHFGGGRCGDVPRGRMVRHECSARFEKQKPRGTTFYVVPSGSKT